MNPYSILTPVMTAVLLASTGLVVVDEAIEHGYTIPDISEKYWDYETFRLHEEHYHPKLLSPLPANEIDP